MTTKTTTLIVLLIIPVLILSRLKCLTSDSNTMAKKGWSVSGGLTAGGEGAVAMAVNFEDEPGIYTVQFSNTRFGGTSQVQKTYAMVDWTVEGVTNRRIMDVYDGASISGVAQAVNVKVVDASAPSGLDYTVTATVAKGVRVSRARCTLIANYDDPSSPNISTVAPAAAYLDGIPDDSGANEVFIQLAASDATNAAIENDEIQVVFGTAIPGAGTGTIVGVGDYTSCNQWIPIPMGARNVRVTNRRTAGDIDVAYIFGIDG